MTGGSRRPVGLFTLVLCALALGCRTPPPPTAGIDLSPCGETEPQADLLCGHLRVPESYAEPDGRQIELFVMWRR